MINSLPNQPNPVSQNDGTERWEANPALIELARQRRSTICWEESGVPAYELPSLWNSGATPSWEDWQTTRRAELLALFEEHVYGRFDGVDGDGMSVEVLESAKGVMDGLADRYQVRLRFLPAPRPAWLDLLIYLPSGQPGKVPVCVGLNFYGNQSVQPDPEILITERWVRQKEGMGVVDNHATEKSRGIQASRWPVSEIIGRGYGVATAYYGDLVPDHADGLRQGLPGLVGGEIPDSRAGSFGAIAVWAWGLSRALDYLQTLPGVDGEKVAVMGHSRLGKTALWAGALDERFPLVISNNSGCGGAALSRRRFGETVEVINTAFPHWFRENFKQFNGREPEIPVDQHMLLALMAPRAVYVASADEDLWADPRGEFQALAHASPVFQLLGNPEIHPDAMPPLECPLHLPRQGYHIRRGGHGVTSYDWQRFMDFADKLFGYQS